MRKHLAAVLCLVLFCLPGSAMNNHPPHVDNYINSYYELAIREMHRSGIPASITLAQGIHESSWGQGELSTNSNNHFGIKCKTSWTGKTYYIEDDDYRNGVLVKSCFRVYQSVDDSYIDHTNFLVQNTRYQKLFSYSKFDYTSWAKGLQSAGYATDPEYANKLIRTIEKYGLNKYDYEEEVQVPEVAVVAPMYILPADTDAVIDLEAGDDEYEESTEEVVATSESIPANEVFVEEASTAYDDEVPAAVSIEDYQRKSRLDQRVSGETRKTVAIQPIEKPAATKPAPAYTYNNKNVPVVEKSAIDTRVNRDNNGNLYQLRAKPRVSRKLRN